MNKRSLAKIGNKNPNWKGDKVGYNALHGYIRKRKTKPELCERCNKRPAFDLANISQKYKRELSDWEYLCRKCHMDGDGRNNKLRESGKSRKLSSKICKYCKKIFHRSSKMKTAKYCSHSCAMKARWKETEKERTKICPICNSEFIPKQKGKTCSRNCGITLGHRNRI